MLSLKHLESSDKLLLGGSVMRMLVCLLTAVVADAQAVRPSTGKIRNKSLEELKETLENIRSSLLSLKPTFNAAAGLVDSYVAERPVDPREAVENAFSQLHIENIPHSCMQEAALKLNEIKAAVEPNCSALHIVEDAGSMAYNTIGFAALGMVTMDDLLNGYQTCLPWYKFWHYIPCVISYAFSSYKELTHIIGAAVTTWNVNEELARDIAYQALCKSTQVSSQLTTSQVLNEAYLCSKTSVQDL